MVAVLAAGCFVVVLRASSRVRLAPAGDGEAAYKNDQTPDATKPALGGFCFASYLVEPGGFEPPSASTPLSVLHA